MSQSRTLLRALAPAWTDTKSFTSAQTGPIYITKIKSSLIIGNNDKEVAWLLPILASEKRIKCQIFVLDKDHVTGWLRRKCLKFDHSMYLCIHRICVFAFVYLHVRHLGTSFLTSLYPVVSKNIAHAWSIVDQILSGENWPLGDHMPIVDQSRA